MKNQVLSAYGRTASYVRAHKIISGIVLLIIIFGGYTAYAKATSTSGETRYVLALASRNTIITSITGTGQVSASNQVDVKPKASGDVIYIGVTQGQTVKAGTLIAELDPSDAEKAVRDAKANLESAQISLQKLQQPADNLSLIQSQNALASAQDDLAKSYDAGFNSVSNAFLDLPGIMSGLQDTLYGTELSHSQDNLSGYADLLRNYDFASVTPLSLKADVADKYAAARDAYTSALTDYKSLSRTSATSTIALVVDETYATTKSVADAVKSANDFLNFIKDTLTVHNQNTPALLTQAQTSLATYTNQLNSHLSDLLNIKNTIVSDQFSITEKTASLAQLQAGTDALDLQSANLSVTQRENALADAEDTLNNYYVRAPFDGTVAILDVKKGDSASSGSAVATMITSQKLAKITLNEVDVSKIKIGDKVNLTFDAIDGLTITGQVAAIDSIGTVSQGVVSYTVTISFDTQDDRVKPGMSVNAAIITDVQADVLTVPASAVKTSGNSHYVEVFNPPLTASGTSGVVSAVLPQQVPVEIGASDDTNTEIVSGISEGEQVVSRTITSTAKTTTSSTPTLFGSTGGARTGGAAGGNVRFISR